MNALATIESNLTRTSKTKDLSAFVKAHCGGLAVAGVTLVLDHSSSMDIAMSNGKTRMEGLDQVVSEIQREAKVAMMAFATGCTFTDKLDPTPGRDINGGTNLGGALKEAAKSCVRCIVISDGEPNDEFYAMDMGKALGRCDTIFVGDKNGGGREFLRRLAAETGGTMFDGDLTEVKKLVGHIVGLLGDGK